MRRVIDFIILVMRRVINGVKRFINGVGRLINKVFTMTNAVTALVSSMIVLVVAVIFWVCNDSRVNKEYHEEISTKLDKIQGIALNAQDILKESSDSLNIEALEDLIEAKIDAAIIEEKSSAIDSNNYMALILTLVTLCVSLSAVIPYIVGKSISKFEIKNVVEDLYAKDKHDVSVKYRESVNMLLASEAHLSRMTAYELLTFYRLQNQTFCLSNLDLRKHPVWVIGWASKALFRYVVIGNLSYIRFCKELSDYIEVYKKGDLDSDPIVLERAFYDLFNALTFDSTLNNGMLDGLTKELKKCLKKLAVSLYKNMTTTENTFVNVDYIKAKAIDKSHKDQYLDSDYFKDKYENDANKLASEILEYLASKLEEEKQKKDNNSDDNIVE